MTDLNDEVLRVDLPPAAAVANLTGPATGIHRLVARPPVQTTAIVIDTDDHRLLDWSIELSRITETGQWVLRAPLWAPPLQAETISPQAEDDLPVDLADVLVPFRRGGILGPRLSVETQRRQFTLEGSDGAVIGELSDERHRIGSHAGQMTAYRNVTLKLARPRPEHLQAITAAFVAAGGVVVTGFEPLAVRLGLSHHGRGRSALSAKVPIGDYVRAQFESRWRRLLRADLEARTGSGDDGALRENVAALLQELVGLEPLLDADWAEQAKQHAEAASETTRPLQHTQRWLRILDLLATASTSPPVRVAAERLTGPVLAQELEAVVQTLLDQCRTLEPYSEDARWSRAHQLAGRAVTLSMLARDVFGKPAKQLRKHLSPINEALAHTLRPDPVALKRDLHGLSTAEIFAAGRAYERTVLSVDYARESFVREWPQLGEALRPHVIRPRAPHTPARPGAVAARPAAPGRAVEPASDASVPIPAATSAAVPS